MTRGPVMRRAVPVALAAAVVAGLLASVRARPPSRPLPAAGAGGGTIASTATATAVPEVRRVSSKRPRRKGPVRTGMSTESTPFSIISVRVTLTGGELTRVETVELSGTGARTEAINARAEPILREEALRAGSAKIDVVTGATYTSRSYMKSLQAAIDEARRRD